MLFFILTRIIIFQVQLFIKSTRTKFSFINCLVILKSYRIRALHSYEVKLILHIKLFLMANFVKHNFLR